MELQKFTKLPDYYRLSCFWQILFSMSCLLILMNLWVVSGGMKLWWSWNTVGIVLIWNWNKFATVPKGSDLLYYTNGSHNVFVRFCVDEVFNERGVTDVRIIKRGKSSILGTPKAPQVNISRIFKHLSMGIPGWYPIFLLQQLSVYLGFCFVHMICVLFVFVFL